MSVHEQIFVRSERTPAQVAGTIAELTAARTVVTDGVTWLSVVVAGPQGPTEFGGPVLPHDSELPFRPPGECEAPDFYNVEIRLWMNGARDAAVEAAAADDIFEAVAEAGFAAIHVRDDDKLIRAVLPGTGLRRFGADTLIYDGDRDEWEGYVLPAR